MKLLALETSSSACSVALMDNDVIIEKHQVLPQQHGQVLLEWMFSLMAEFNLKITDLEAIGYSCGPGGFTGIRIGAAVAQGMSVASNLPIIAVPSLQVIAQGIYREHGCRRVTIVMDARMQQVYYGRYEVNQEGQMLPATIDQLVNYQEIPLVSDPICLVTDIGEVPEVNEFSHGFKHVFSSYYPKAHDVLLIAKNRILAGEVPDPRLALPVYLRSEASWKKCK